MKPCSRVVAPEKPQVVAPEKPALVLEYYNSHVPPKWVTPVILVNIFCMGTTFAPVGYLRRVHYNREHPENWNLYWPNIRDSRIMLYQNGEWCYQDFDSWVEMYLFGVLHILKTYLPSYSEDLERQTFQDMYDKKIKKRWKRDIKDIMIGSMRKTIKNAHKL